MAGASWTPTGYVTSPCNVPALLGQFLEGVATCENVAVGGTTSPQWLYAQGAIGVTWEARMAATDARIVVINTGINDVFIPGLSWLDYRWCYAEFARLARAAGKLPVYMTPTPINDAHLGSLWEFQHAMKALAAETSVPVINAWDAVVAAAPQWQSLLPDNIHPNDAMYRLMASIAHVALRQVLATA